MDMTLTLQQVHMFQETVWDHYAKNGRAGLPWRQPEADGSFDPYKIMVSELMLQQTQVARVIPKFERFLEWFPSIGLLAAADLGDVLRAWQGLGYNRRAKYLWQAARRVVELGVFPASLEGLVRLPGIGPNTAAAILVYSYDMPVDFIETNVRTVYIHHFFDDQENVDDKQLRALIVQTADKAHPRDWYWAIMDYGSHLKATVGNKSRASKTYARQAVFHGSRRQLRGKVIRLLGKGNVTAAELATATDGDERLADVLDALLAEGLIRQKDGTYHL